MLGSRDPNQEPQTRTVNHSTTPERLTELKNALQRHSGQQAKIPFQASYRVFQLWNKMSFSCAICWGRCPQSMYAMQYSAMSKKKKLGPTDGVFVLNKLPESGSSAAKSGERMQCVGCSYMPLAYSIYAPIRPNTGCVRVVDASACISSRERSRILQANGPGWMCTVLKSSEERQQAEHVTQKTTILCHVDVQRVEDDSAGVTVHIFLGPRRRIFPMLL